MLAKTAIFYNLNILNSVKQSMKKNIKSEMLHNFKMILVTVKAKWILYNLDNCKLPQSEISLNPIFSSFHVEHKDLQNTVPGVSNAIYFHFQTSQLLPKELKSFFAPL